MYDCGMEASVVGEHNSEIIQIFYSNPKKYHTQSCKHTHKHLYICVQSSITFRDTYQLEDITK